MPRPRIKEKIKRKARKKPSPLLGVAPGQKGRLRIGASELHVTRTADKVILKRMPKKQRLIRE